MRIMVSNELYDNFKLYMYNIDLYTIHKVWIQYGIYDLRGYFFNNLTPLWSFYFFLNIFYYTV